MKPSFSKISLVALLLVSVAAPGARADIGYAAADDSMQHEAQLDLKIGIDDFTGDKYEAEDFVDFAVQRMTARHMQDAAAHLVGKRRWVPNDPGDISIDDEDGGRREAPTADFPLFFGGQLVPIENDLLDWVPNDADRLHNGGFGKAPDNGAPVPYKLNGHVGIERGYPWDPDN